MISKLQQSALLFVALLVSVLKVSAQAPDSTMARLFSMDLEQLLNVTVSTAGKQTEKVTDIPASVVLVTRNDIKTAGYTSLSQILENIPGMFLVNNYYHGPAIGVRGFCPTNDNHNIIILVNGINQLYDLSNAYIFDNIPVPVEAIDRIEVIRGPMSVVYGSGASYGVINIITNESQQSEFSLAAGSFSTWKAFGRGVFSQNNLKCIVNASIFHTRGIDQPFNKLSGVAPAAYGLKENYSTNGKLGTNERFLDIFCSYKSLSFGLNLNEATTGGYFFVPSPKGNTYFPKRLNAFADYKKPVSKFITLHGKLTYFSTSNYANYNLLFNNFYGNQHQESHAIEGEFNIFVKPAKQFEVVTGLFVHSILDGYNSFDLPSYNIPSFSNQYINLMKGDQLTIRSFYVQTYYQPLPNLKFVAGFRLEQMPSYKFEIINPDTIGPFVHFPRTELEYKDTKLAFTPRLSAIWSVTDRNIIKLMYGRAITRPSFFQTTSNALNPNASQLQPEWITTYEMNITSFVTENLVLNAGVFYNSLDNLIVRVSKQDESTGAFVTWFGNSGTMNTVGAEVTVQATMAKKLRVEMSGTYQKTRDMQSGHESRDVAYSPRMLGYGKLTYSLSPRFNFGLTTTYVGSMVPFYDETVKNKDGTFGARIGHEVDGYLLLGANARLDDILEKGYYLNLRCNNLLNSEIRYPTTTNNAWAEKGYLDAGFNFLISIGKRF